MAPHCCLASSLRVLRPRRRRLHRQPPDRVAHAPAPGGTRHLHRTSLPLGQSGWGGSDGGGGARAVSAERGAGGGAAAGARPRPGRVGPGPAGLAGPCGRLRGEEPGLRPRPQRCAEPRALPLAAPPAGTGAAGVGGCREGSLL